MAIEIERRFLVCGDGWRQHVRWQAELQQGYLRSDPDGLTLRVRCSQPLPCTAAASSAPLGPQAWLTLKAPAPGAAADPAAGAAALQRLEFEYAIPITDAEALLSLAPHALRKRRYGLALPGGDWVVDVFAAANAPLVIAEVELERADAALQPPAWCALELTADPRLSNAALARTPLQAWPGPQREALLAAMQPGDGIRGQAWG